MANNSATATMDRSPPLSREMLCNCLPGGLAVISIPQLSGSFSSSNDRSARPPLKRSANAMANPRLRRHLWHPCSGRSTFSLESAKLSETQAHQLQTREDRHDSCVRCAPPLRRFSFAVATRALAVERGDPAIHPMNHADRAIRFHERKLRRIVLRVAPRSSQRWLAPLRVAYCGS